MTMARRGRVALLAGLAAVAGCTLGPDYRAPRAPVPPAYKEIPGWKLGEPADGRDRGAWWRVFADPALDQLEAQVAVSNQNVRQFEAQYRQAVALVAEARAQLFPVLGATAGVQRGAGGAGSSSISSTVGSGAGGLAITQYRVEPNLSWSPDVWGIVRRTVESRQAGAQMSAAQLANARLAAQVTLATDYFSLHAADSARRLMARSVAEFRRTMEIIENQFRAGTASGGDLAGARLQLATATAQMAAVDQLRGSLEHAIAVLVGKSPAQLAIDDTPLAQAVPAVPVQVPSTLLERNPAIAAAERQMQQQNALIGVATGAYYPQVTLSGVGGYASDALGRLFDAGSRLWSLGLSGSATLLEAGGRRAAVDAARAAYDQAVANYRQTVLSSFQQVEDGLLAVRVLERQAQFQAQAVEAAGAGVEVARLQFEAGTVAYTAVSAALQAQFSSEQTALAIQQNRLVACVTLIGALGGGWDAASLPSH